MTDPDYDPTVCYVCGIPADESPRVRFLLDDEQRNCCLPCAGYVFEESMDPDRWQGGCADAFVAAFRHTATYRDLLAGLQ